VEQRVLLEAEPVSSDEGATLLCQTDEELLSGYLLLLELYPGSMQPKAAKTLSKREVG